MMISRIIGLVLGVRRRLCALAFRLRGLDQRTRIPIRPRSDLKRLGADCGWVVPVALLGRDTVCYCVGAGEDITFDVALAIELDCEVHTFDPTPKAITYVTRLKDGLPARLSFHPWGVWDRDECVRFYAPKDPSHVSHSAINLQKTARFFEADCKRLHSIMHELGHRSLGLLKLDIEGAEYKVLQSMVADGIRPQVLAVEFDEIHSPSDNDAPFRIKSAAEMLVAFGYTLTSVDGPNYTFIMGQ